MESKYDMSHEVFISNPSTLSDSVFAVEITLIPLSALTKTILGMKLEKV